MSEKSPAFETMFGNKNAKDTFRGVTVIDNAGLNKTKDVGNVTLRGLPGEIVPDQVRMMRDALAKNKVEGSKSGNEFGGALAGSGDTLTEDSDVNSPEAIARRADMLRISDVKNRIEKISDGANTTLIVEKPLPAPIPKPLKKGFFGKLKGLFTGK